MKKLLIVSFDLIRLGEPTTSLSIGNLLASLQSNENYGNAFTTEHFGINLLDELSTNKDMQCLKALQFSQYEWIAVSAYVWGEKWMRQFLHYLRNEYRYKGIIILGGYQVSYSNDEQLVRDYPEADNYIKGFAEQTLLKTIIDYTKGNVPAKIISPSPQSDLLPSPYLTGVIELQKNQTMVRMEAKRGCPYKCSFCAHKDNLGGRVNALSLEKVMMEIDLMKKKRVSKINFLDPVFNMNGDYLEILKYFNKINYPGLISLQSRPELIAGEKGAEFLNHINELDVILEFGTQTLDDTINKTIKRQNNYMQIFGAFEKVKDAGIKFEVSLIYGLPGQTLSSFEKDISTLRAKGVTEITAWPLMLLKGTQLFTQKEQFAFREANLGRFSIPHVVESSTYSEQDWLRMHEIAVTLNPNSRVL